MIPYHSSIKSSRVGFNGEPRPLGYQPPGMTGMRRHRSSRQRVAGVGSGGGRSGNRLGRVILGEF